jgi:hypothetical protein
MVNVNFLFRNRVLPKESQVLRGKGEDMGQGNVNGIPAREILSMLRKAIREDWPVTHEQKIKSAQTIARIVENADNIFSPKDVMTATRVQLEMSNSNIKNAIAVDYAELQREKFDLLSSLEKNIAYSLADGPDQGPIVSDTPMPSIEYIDISPQEPEE